MALIGVMMTEKGVVLNSNKNYNSSRSTLFINFTAERGSSSLGLDRINCMLYNYGITVYNLCI